MKNIISFLAITFFILSCGVDPLAPQEEHKQEISKQEERVLELSKNVQDVSEADSAKVELVNILLDFYHKYPKDDYSANCLSKVHMVYSSQNQTKLAVAYADTIIDKYPKFVDRMQMIESQITAYEMLIRPRNVEMIKKYLNLWLKENKDADKEKISDVKYHLKNVDTPLEERIGMDLQELK